MVMNRIFGQDAPIGKYELRLSPSLGRAWAGLAGIHIQTPKERNEVFSRAAPTLRQWLEHLNAEDGWGRRYDSDSVLPDVLSPDYYGAHPDVATRTTQIRLPEMVTGNLNVVTRDPAMSTFMPPVYRRSTREITGAGWATFEQVLFLLQVIFPGMVWFQRVDGTPEENRALVMAQRVNPLWMKMNAHVLEPIVGSARFDALYAIFTKEWDGIFEGFPCGI
jgi:hypothetical protein